MPRPKSTGLPKDQEEQLRAYTLLDLAAEVFLESGFEAASVNEIARRTGVTKQTFYARFPSKEKLFLAVIARRMAQMTEHFGTILDERLPVREVLLSVALNYHNVVLGREHLALLRIVYMETTRFPEIGKTFLESGPGQVGSRLTKFLAAQMSLGVLRRSQPQVAAEQFLALVSGRSLQRALLGMPEQSTKKRVHERMAIDVDSFLSIYASPDVKLLAEAGKMT